MKPSSPTSPEIREIDAGIARRRIEDEVARELAPKRRTEYEPAPQPIGPLDLALEIPRIDAGRVRCRTEDEAAERANWEAFREARALDPGVRVERELLDQAGDRLVWYWKRNKPMAAVNELFNIAMLWHEAGDVERARSVAFAGQDLAIAYVEIDEHAEIAVDTALRGLRVVALLATPETN